MCLSGQRAPASAAWKEQLEGETAEFSLKKSPVRNTADSPVRLNVGDVSPCGRRRGRGRRSGEGGSCSLRGPNCHRCSDSETGCLVIRNCRHADRRWGSWGVRTAEPLKPCAKCRECAFLWAGGQRAVVISEKSLLDS